MEHEDTAIAWVEDTATGREIRLHGGRITGPDSYDERDYYRDHPEAMELLMAGTPPHIETCNIE